MIEVPNANTVAARQDNTKLDEIMRKIISEISHASAEGRRSCTLPETTETQGYDYAIRASLTAAGYSIEPYGTSGGVKQNTKLICW